MATAELFLEGMWRPATAARTFQAYNPQTGEPIGDEFPVSGWPEMDQALQAAAQCDALTRDWPAERFAELLEIYADLLEENAEAIVEQAHQETALPISPRLKDVEMPRTYNQLRTAAAEARKGDWSLPVIDEENNIRSMYRSIGPVMLMGPNNFPLAFNSISGGDFAAAIAAGNPVIAKGHPAHPGTTRMMAELLEQALKRTEFPAGIVQLIYDIAPEEGLKAIRDPRLAAVAFTGSQPSGVAIKAAADACGKPSFLEMSSINPVFVLPDKLAQDADGLANEFVTSCLMGCGQFCTNPGLVMLPPGDETDNWMETIRERFASGEPGTLLTKGVQQSMLEGIQRLEEAGAKLLTGGNAVDGGRFAVENTLFTIEIDQYLDKPHVFQREVFGNCSLLVKTTDVNQMPLVAATLEGQLTGCVYLTDSDGDEEAYAQLEPVLRRKVGRLLNNKMPTGVAVSPGMNHGGPFPATGHPGYTAIGLPAAIRRFSMLECYDNVPEHRLPSLLRTS